MSDSSLSLASVHEQLRAGRLADAVQSVERLRRARPELAELYDRKLVELRKLERLSGAGKISAAPAPVLRELPDRLSLEQLIFVTPSCAANDPKRRAIEATWGETLRRRGVRQFFIVGCPELDRASSLGQVIYVPCRDDYESLLLKLALAYEYLLANEKNFTHIFKIDDDCYLNLTRFEQNLLCMEGAGDYVAGAVQPSNERINRRWHFGKCSDARFDKEYPHDFPPVAYAKGGYGYLLSMHSMTAVVKQIPVFRRELEQYVYAYEDLRIGDVLRGEGISVKLLPNYEVAPASAVTASSASVVYDISNAAQFQMYHQELAVRALHEQRVEDFVGLAYAQGVAVSDTLGFDHVYLVNLRSAIDRRASVQWALNKEGVRYELVPAVDGHSPVGLGLLKMVQDRPVGDLPGHPQFGDLEKWRGSKFIDSAGAIGYIMTYVRILLDAKKRGFGKVLILEDDVLLAKNFRARLARFMTIVGDDWRVLHLGASQYGWGSVDHDTALREGRYRPRVLDTCGSFAMAINTNIVDELIGELLCFDAPFDHLPLGQIYERYETGCHVAYPNIVIPDVSDSYIRGGREQESHSVKMRWSLSDFQYPRPRIRIGVVFLGDAGLRCAPPPEYGVDLFCYRATQDGLRPVHDSCQTFVPQEPISAEQEGHLLERMQFLPVDALYATRRSCDGAEVVIEILDAPSRFGAEDRRSREWLRPLHNRAKPSTRGLAAVVIPTRGRTDALAAAIESVLSQDYPDKEVIVIDENEIGTPAGDFVRNHVDALKKKGAPIRLVRHSRPRNAAAARNTGLFSTQAEFVSFLDDDDAYLPGRLSLVIDLLRSSGPQIGGAYCGYLGWNSKKSDPGRYPTTDIPRRLLNLEFSSHYVCTDTVTYRREALLSVNGYDESFRRHQDLELNVRVFRQWDICAYPEALVQLNPLPPDNSNKLYDIDLFDVKMRFLSKFDDEIERLGLDRTAIYASHVKEMRNFTKDAEGVERFALENPSIFSSAYLDCILKAARSMANGR